MYVLYIAVCIFVFFLLAVVLSVRLLHTDSDYLQTIRKQHSDCEMSINNTSPGTCVRDKFVIQIIA